MGKNDVGRVGTPTQRLWRKTFVNDMPLEDFNAMFQALYEAGGETPA
jgi:hypothetical protein